jgi:hypothetical protein
MTVIGKILTFLVFFFSLVFLGFAVTINMLNKDPKTKLSWYGLAKKHEKDMQKLQEDLNARDAENIALRGQLSKLQNQMALDKAAFDKGLQAAQDDARAARNELTAAKSNADKTQVSVSDSAAELQTRRQEAMALNEQLKLKETQISDLIAQHTAVTNRAVQAEVNMKSFQERLMALQNDYRQVVQALEREREERTASATGVGDTQQVVVRRPPLEDVSGRIKSVTPEGLVSLSVGSDQGLMKGHTLEVFRSGPRPQYLGTLQVIEVTPHEAVGRLSPQMRKLVQPNDQVASRIMPAR